MGFEFDIERVSTVLRNFIARFVTLDSMMGPEGNIYLLNFTDATPLFLEKVIHFSIVLDSRERN